MWLTTWRPFACEFRKRRLNTAAQLCVISHSPCHLTIKYMWKHIPIFTVAFSLPVYWLCVCVSSVYEYVKLNKYHFPDYRLGCVVLLGANRNQCYRKCIWIALVWQRRCQACGSGRWRLIIFHVLWNFLFRIPTILFHPFQSRWSQRKIKWRNSPQFTFNFPI